MYPCGSIINHPIIQVDPELKVLAIKPFISDKSINFFAYGVGFIGQSRIEKFSSLKYLSNFQRPINVTAFLLKNCGIGVILGVFISSLWKSINNLYYYNLTKSIEEKSMENRQNGIVLDIRCSHASDPNGVSDFDSITVANSKIYAKKYAVVTKRMPDRNAVVETFKTIEEVSKSDSLKVLILSGHGSPDGIAMGSSPRSGFIIRKTHKNILVNSLSRMAVDGVIILNSCETAKGKYNIANDFRLAAGKKTVYAADKNVWRYILKEDPLSTNQTFPYVLNFKRKNE